MGKQDVWTGALDWMTAHPLLYQSIDHCLTDTFLVGALISHSLAGGSRWIGFAPSKAPQPLAGTNKPCALLRIFPSYSNVSMYILFLCCLKCLCRFRIRRGPSCLNLVHVHCVICPIFAVRWWISLRPSGLKGVVKTINIKTSIAPSSYSQHQSCCLHHLTRGHPCDIRQKIQRAPWHHLSRLGTAWWNKVALFLDRPWA